MERTNFGMKLSVSPSFSIPGGGGVGVAGENKYHCRRDFADGSSSQIIENNFSGPISSLRGPKSEILWFDLSPSDDDVLVKSNPYELRPLPDLLSFEYPVPDPISETLPYPPQSIFSGGLFPAVIESSSKRFRPSPWSPCLGAARVPVFRCRKLPSSEIARRRRSKISERIKILEGLMPWDARMTMGRLLEEAHKYIRFLEAQVTALQTMPAQLTPANAGIRGVGRSSVLFGGLEMLNRQQMLQVMVNSAAVQNLLYKKECCVFSSEQVAELGRGTGEGKLTLMLLPASTSSASN